VRAPSASGRDTGTPSQSRHESAFLILAKFKLV
jgi:hypothetical protein